LVAIAPIVANRPARGQLPGPGGLHRMRRIPAPGYSPRDVRGLAGRAASVHDASGRAEIYGEIASTCAACHAWLGGGPSASAVP
jgi:mono/diheme cytochrome c family protein